MTVNSPFYHGRDTGHASWRAVLWSQWPSAGPAPHFEDAQDYERAVREMIACGAMLDDGMVYWYARPSTRYPTVEVRVGDVCLTVADAVLIAALVRGLVTALLRDDRAPAPHVPHWLLAAAHWRASRDGLAAKLFDPQTGTEQPAWTLVDRLAGARRLFADHGITNYEAVFTIRDFGVDVPDDSGAAG